MKNLKIIFAAFLMMAFAMNLNAQITIGARGGLTLATYNTDPMPENFLGEQDMKYMAGVDAAANLGKARSCSLASLTVASSTPSLSRICASGMRNSPL